jgi:hypothetical protein
MELLGSERMEVDSGINRLDVLRAAFNLTEIRRLGL